MTMSQTNPPPGDFYAITDSTSSDMKFTLLPNERIYHSYIHQFICCFNHLAIEECLVAVEMA